MATVDVLDASGKVTGTVDLPAEIFDVQTNVPLIHQVVVAQLAAARQGTASTKTRGEVSGGGRKPYKQKGTGRARQGSTRAPQFTGGGVVHGPKPRDYAQRTPKKMKAAALRGALSDRARHGRVQVVTSLVTGEEPSTKAASAALAAINEHAKVLVVVERGDEVTWKSLRNVDRAHLSGRRPAQHLRRAVRGLGAVHRSGTGLVPGRSGQGARRQGRGVEQRAGEQGGRQVSVAGNIHKDPRDILLAPVVSEKSYGLLDQGKYTFLVDPRREQDRDQEGRGSGLRGEGLGGQHQQPPGQDTPHPQRGRTAQGHQARGGHPEGRHHRHLRRAGRLTAADETRRED